MNYVKVFSCFSWFLPALIFCEISVAGPLTNQSFIDTASIKSISEIETAKIALEKSNSNSVKFYAQAVLEEHTFLLTHLRRFAKAQHLDMMSDSELQAQARRFIFQRKGQTFDEAYADMRFMERKKSVSLFREVAEMATGDIKQYAANELPTLMHHLYMAQTLVGALAKDAPLMADDSSQL